MEASRAKGAWERRGVETAVALAGVALLAWAWHCDMRWFERYFQGARCMRSDKALRGAMAWRAFGASTGVLLLFVVRPLLARWTGRRSARERWGGVARIAMAVLAALSLCELFLRWKETPPAVPRPRPDLPAAREARLTGWALEPSRTTTWNIGGRSVEYAVNAEGVRARSVSDNVDRAAPTLIFAGESVVFGIGLRYDETFAAQVGQRLGVQSVNAGVHGFSGAQAYVHAVAEVMPRFERPLAVVTIVLAEQVERNKLTNRAVLRIGPLGLLEHAAPAPEWSTNVRLGRLWSEVFHSNDDEAFEIERAVLRETARAARARGAVPLFVVTNYASPCMAVDGEAPWLFDALFDGTDLLRVDVALDPSWTVRDDPHPDARAHEKLADATVKALRCAAQSSLGGEPCIRR